MPKETTSTNVAAEVIAPPLAQFSEADTVMLTNLARLCSQPIPILAGTATPQTPYAEVRAAAEFRQIKAELRTNFEQNRGA
jgi:hypothetical protein